MDFCTAIMDFRTKTDIISWSPRLRHSDRLLVMGSCFAEHIGSRLEQMKFRSMLNPYGILYNPLSIAEALMRLMEQQPFAEEELREFPDGGWNTWLHHSRYSHPDKTEALMAINHSVVSASRLLRQADTLIITFGTAWVYRLRDTLQVVGNCHKVPDREFVRQRLTVEEITDVYAALLSRLWNINPKVRVLFTVSPVRHLKDTLHGNQLSKSTLLLAVDELCRRYPERLFYFPAYEIVVDELRDYRFYAEDMAHPSLQAVEYVWEQFVEYMTDREAQAFIVQWSKITKALAHRPFHPETDGYKQFVLQNIEKIKSLKEKYPYLEVQSEIASCCAQCKGCEENKSVQ